MRGPPAEWCWCAPMPNASSCCSATRWSPNIRTRARGRFFNLVDLVNQLEQEKAAGRSGRLSEKLLRYDVIVIDELGYLPFSQSVAAVSPRTGKISTATPSRS